MAHQCQYCGSSEFIYIPVRSVGACDKAQCGCKVCGRWCVRLIKEIGSYDKERRNECQDTDS